MKDSGVEWLGSVPVHWDIMPLRYFIRTTKGFAFKSTDFRDEGVRVVRATDIKQKTILKSAVFLPKEFLGTHHKVRLTTGNIIISTVGSNPDVINSAVGQIGMVPEELNNTLLNQNTVILKPTKRVSNNFLIHLLSSTAYRENLDLYAHGTANQSSLSLEDILNYKSAIPTIEEQEIIYAEINQKVSLIEKLIKKSNCSIKLSRKRRTALISAAVTGKIDIREEVAHAVI